MALTFWLPPGLGHHNHTVPSRQNPGQSIICSWADCTRPADSRIEIAWPHERPSYPGELVRIIFCSAAHRAHHIRRTRQDHS
jgi:hypothetical protein